MTRALFLLGMMLAVGELSAALEIAVRDSSGRPIAPDAVKLDVRRTSVGGVETVGCRLTSRIEGTLLLRLEGRVALDAGQTTFFDGGQTRPLAGVSTNALFLGTFPMGAAWGAGPTGVALALGAEAGDSYADLVVSPQDMKISVHAALVRKGTVYETVFHRLAFNPKYGAMDAFAAYYPLYPRRFTRNPAVDPGICGINATYASWRRADPEPCRFMNASVECCIGASRTWGDVNDREQPVGPRNTAYAWDEEIGYVNRAGKYRRRMNGEITQAEFDAIRDERLACGYFCGVRNAYYVMALANISNEIARRHPDSVAVGKSFADNSYPYSTEVFTFPECSWGQDIRRQLKELSETADIGAVYFDVSRPRAVYRGERLTEMTNVSWDEHGPGIVRGVASAKLFNYVRTLKAKKSRYRLGVSVNTKYEHATDIFYADVTESESSPWDREKPFPLARRLAAGEKGFGLWEGFATREFDPNFNQWPQEEKDLLVNALARFAVHASFRTGATLPLAFLAEYTALMSHAFIRMDAVGWKPVPGAQAEGSDWEVARYGLGVYSYLAVNNLSNVVRTATLSVFLREIATGRAGGAGFDGGVLYVPFFGGAARTRLTEGGETVSFPVGAQLAGVLEAVGTAEGRGALKADWSGDCEALKLTLVSEDFRGTVRLKARVDRTWREGKALRELKPGERVEVVYRTGELKGVFAAIRAWQGVPEIACADEADSRELAARVAVFFERATGGRRPTVKVEAQLDAPAVRVGGFVIASDDRWELSRLVNRFLNIVNRERYPQYRPPTPMADADRVFYPFLRF